MNMVIKKCQSAMGKKLKGKKIVKNRMVLITNGNGVNLHIDAHCAKKLSKKKK